MKPIKITEANWEKINTAIQEAEGRATVRTIDSKDVLNAIREIEKYFGLSKKMMVGVWISVDLNAQEFPKAYKYTPESTHFDVLRKDSGWYLMDVSRERCRVPSKKFVMISRLTEEQEKAILNRFYAWR